MKRVFVVAASGLILLGAPGNRPARDDRAVLAGLDKAYQEAVRAKDVRTMSRILADDFILVTGAGHIYSKADLLAEAHDSAMYYERQEDSAQTVRLWGETAVVTALLWEKGTDHGKPFDRHLWFSDTYVRSGGEWRYIFGQSSLPLR